MRKEEINNSLQVSDLISDYLVAQLTEQRLQLLLAWIEEDQENRNVFERICDEKNLNAANLSFKVYNSDLALQKVKNELRRTNTISPVRKLQKWVAGVAAIIALIGFAVYFFKTPANLKKDQVITTLSAREIKPGKNVAILSFADGKKIRLSDVQSGLVMDASQVKYNDGSPVSALNGTKLLTITTPRGGTYQVRLSDGTRVWLNAASSLTYLPALMVNGERRVKLLGEAYFEVTKDKAHPFVVESAGQQVTVLGTHFNINSYQDEQDTKTTLVEGSIKVNGVFLKPSQQSVMTGHTNRLEVKEVDPSLAVAWKDGKFRCRREKLESLLRKVGRWYDVDIVYENEAAKQQTFSGTLSKADNFEKVLKRIALTGEANFKVEGRSVIVTR
ncbi:FecR domain-containing protein [Pedobacter steynii]|nr:FecR domain-containing protein [Pedobacter steynii]NQX41395.1 FecR domain-containing protein [Pedobacter steynii]